MKSLDNLTLSRNYLSQTLVKGNYLRSETNRKIARKILFNKSGALFLTWVGWTSGKSIVLGKLVKRFINCS